MHFLSSFSPLSISPIKGGRYGQGLASRWRGIPYDDCWFSEMIRYAPDKTDDVLSGARLAQFEVLLHEGNLLN